MLNKRTLLLSCCLVLGAVSTAHAQNALVNIPGVQVQTSANGGAMVSVPGVHVNTNTGTTRVAPTRTYAQPQTQPIQINAGQAPTYGTRVQAPGVNIQTGVRGTTVQAPGVNIQTGAAPVPQAAVQMRPAPAQAIAVPVQTTVQPGRGVSFVNADLKNKDFSNKYLVGADFTNADLTNVDFSGADLRKARLINADLTNANLKGALLMSADFTNASFIRTNLSNANLTNANLTNVGIEGALATGTVFTNAILTNVDIKAFVIQREQPAPAPKQVMVRKATPKVAVKASAPKAAPTPAPKAPAYKAPDQIKLALQMSEKEPKKARKVNLTINFEMDSDMLTGSGGDQVKAVGEALASPELKGSYIIVEGHTDNVGNASYNDELSFRRAMRVLFTLRDQYGVPHKMLQAKGYGEKNPLASNKSDIGRALNRRVTIVNMGR